VQTYYGTPTTFTSDHAQAQTMNEFLTR